MQIFQAVFLFRGVSNLLDLDTKLVVLNYFLQVYLLIDFSNLNIYGWKILLLVFFLI